MSGIQVSVVVPVFSSLPHLPELHRRLNKTLTQAVQDYELIFVDDAGHDGSLTWLHQCATRDGRVRVVEMPENKGQHRAVLEGLAVTRGKVIVVLDADLQDQPEEIPLLLRALNENDGVVFARRNSRFESRTRHLTSFFFKRILRIISGSRIPKNTGMFFAASSGATKTAVELASETSYVPLLFDQTGCPLNSVEIDKVNRAESVSTYTTGRRLKLAGHALLQALKWRSRRWRSR